MSRALRRAEVARFRRAASSGVTSYLVAKDDPRLQGEPLLLNALDYWRRNIPARKPKCFACRAPFASDGAQAAAFLMVTAASAPTSATVSGLCVRCWAELPMPDIERAAARTLRPVMPNGLDDSENP